MLLIQVVSPQVLVLEAVFRSISKMRFFLLIFLYNFLLFGEENNKSYLLPPTHPVYFRMEKIFSRGSFQDLKSFHDAGFEVLCLKKDRILLVATHPLLKGYVIKAYLNSTSQEIAHSNLQTLRNRIIGALKIKSLIKRYRIQHFTVADKWLYELPFSTPEHPLFVLLATDMNICTLSESKVAWKTKITPQHLQEFLRIVKGGCASTGLLKNIPYTKDKKFAFIDTEYPDRTFDLEVFKHYLSDEMKEYWDSLIENLN